MTAPISRTISAVAPRLVLGSSSPRRRALLREAGFEFTLEEPGVDEAAQPGESPEAQARRLALAKAQTVAGRVGPGNVVLAADTLVVIDDCVLGKPRDHDEAVQMLLRLAGRVHRVLTGFALLGDNEMPVACEVVESGVRMRAISPDEARAYAQSGEPLDKAGAYAAQGDGGRFIAAIEGSRSNVIGLPLERVVPLLEALGVKRA